MPYKLLFVCLGNICRSPAAENIMNHLIAEADLSEQIICESAGTASYHVGNPPDRRMVAAASQRGMKFLGEARQFQKIDFEQFDLILAMDGENYRDIISLDPAGKYRDKVRMMCDFCTQHKDKEVPDPYYGGSDGFNYVIDLLSDACQGLLQYIINNQASNSRAKG
ncbi:low molecular weight protein-tyrosine-phosphatase [Microcoleus sp. FACHB-672]|uniref:low molecular weight protein-tyrosine-phosphatase n=1 Tax=Microcoleus sp. FACHB-672 TaxID=2692825 RepID=UPI001688F147|nr:low molecular weight protein-tyrosine-phosphatase [Microcoleus sp. FACHB-672]MBD2041292.1 low molecular weight phosphotyrosine protein phosphatase [Microcoleus sp. FACHB-672]